MPHWTEIGSTTTASGTFLTDVYRNEETGLKDLLDKFFKTKKVSNQVTLNVKLTTSYH